MHNQTTRVSARPVKHIDVDQIIRAGGCEHPIRLRGSVERVDLTSGEISSWTTDNLPGGAAYVACKSRRSTRCAPCSRIYQGDAYHLIASGLRGGKGIPESVATHPAVFVTLTAPSFDVVHGTRNGGFCHPRSRHERCPHGNDTSCWKRHDDDDEELGQPICAGCFDYEAGVVWNAHAGSLWRATRIGIDRQLARLTGRTNAGFKALAKTQYIKVAEFQKRGLVHFHVIVRVDAISELIDIDCDLLTQGIRQTINNVSVPTDDGSRIRWGKQLDIVNIAADENQGSITRSKVSGYLAKYATKSTDASGAFDRRLTREDLDYLKTTAHLTNLAKTAWQLALQYPKLRCRLWAHQLGFRGHFCTKSKSWSTTFAALQLARRDYEIQWRTRDENTTSETVKSKWSYAGTGYLSEIEENLAEFIRPARKSRTSEANNGP